LHEIFDKVNNRVVSNSSRWTKKKNTIALTIGDSDFPLPSPIRDSLIEKADQVLGYENISDSLNDIVIERADSLYDWKIEKHWIVYLPSIVLGLNLCCRIFLDKDEKAISELPVYPPIFNAVANANRSLMTLDSHISQDRWGFDFDKFSDLAREKNLKLFLICNPQNPLGRSMNREEIERLAEMCVENDLLVCSDEMHADIVFDKRKHFPLATVGDSISQRTITFMSPSKSHAMSGLGGAFAVIPNDDLRKRFLSKSKGLIPDLNILTLTAMEVAYAKCDPWFHQMLRYLEENRNFLMKDLGRLKGIEIIEPEGTYFLWIDFRKTGREHPVEDLLSRGLELSDGADFGKKGFLRMNFASPRSVLREACKIIQALLD